MKAIVVLAAVSVLVALTGCAAGPHTKVISRMVGMDGTLDPLMTRTNLVGVVAFDEKHVNNVGGYTNTTFYVQNIRKGTPEAQYRAVQVNTGLMAKSDVLWVKSGSRTWSTAAFVPDHISALKAGDYVEYRSITGWDSNVTWLAGGDGQAVLRVLCRKGQEDFETCVDNLPAWNGFKGMGHTNTPFPDSVQEYKYTYSKFYDEDGKLLKPLPD